MTHAIVSFDATIQRQDFVANHVPMDTLDTTRLDVTFDRWPVNSVVKRATTSTNALPDKRSAVSIHIASTLMDRITATATMDSCKMQHLAVWLVRERVRMERSAIAWLNVCTPVDIASSASARSVGLAMGSSVE